MADEQLVARLREVLKDADFETTTGGAASSRRRRSRPARRSVRDSARSSWMPPAEKQIRKGLEEHFGEDLTEKKLLIRENVSAAPLEPRAAAASRATHQLGQGQARADRPEPPPRRRRRSSPT